MTAAATAPSRPTYPLERALAGRHIPALDGIRAIAAGLVVLGHAGTPAPGDTGVLWFFVLSGFLITLLLLREHDATGSVDLRAFYARRALRLLPAYYVLIAVMFAVQTLQGHAWTLGFAASLLFYYFNYYKAWMGREGVLAHTWSLAVEEQFYLLWPFAFRWLRRQGIRALAWALGLTVAGATLWRCGLYLFAGQPTFYIYHAFDTRLDSLALGCLIAVALRHPAAYRLAARLVPSAAAPLPTLALLGLSRFATPSGYHYTVGFLVDAVLLAILLLQLVQLHEHRAWRLLDSAPMRYLGRISYPVYLWHQFAAAVAHRLSAQPAAVFALTVGGTVVIASGSYYVVERPLLRLKRRFEAIPTA
ncbi:MAG: acyltransferase [Gemmatimonadales bacterium]|nr:acyltransferase [Gemmatimonadales bacterium]